jgi:hypothetical protein
VQDTRVIAAEKVSRQSIYTAELVAVDAASYHAAEYDAHSLVRDKFA